MFHDAENCARRQEIDLAEIVSLKTPSTAKPARRVEPATIILFPGVRYEQVAARSGADTSDDPYDPVPPKRGSALD